MKDLKNSPRLLTFHAILKDRKWHSTAEIEDLSRDLAANDSRYRRICAVNSTASDMRRKGYDIACRPNGKRYEYRYVRRSAA